MYFEELNVGDKLITRPRLVTGTDIDIFAITTGAVNPTFLDDRSAKKAGHESRIAPGLLTTSLSIGLLYSLGLFDNLIALLSIDNLRFLAPVKPGDELRCSAEIIDRRETNKKDRGIVTIKWSCQNQEGKQVLEAAKFVFALQRKP